MPKNDDNEALDQDLAFILELKEASLDRLLQLRLNLSFGGPEWQRVAVARAIAARESQPLATDKT